MLSTKQSAFVPSKYQLPILEHVEQNLAQARHHIRDNQVKASIADLNVRNINITASAGSGKTTLLAEAFRLHYEMGFPISSVQVLSFVRKNIQDITNKFKEIVQPEDRKLIEKQINTFNSFGQKMCQSAYDIWNRNNTDKLCATDHIYQENKYQYITEQMLYKYSWNSALCSISSLVTFIDKLREQIILFPEVADLRHLATEYRIRHNLKTEEHWQSVLNLCNHILRKGVSNANPYFTPTPLVDFIDQCFVPFAVAQGSERTQYYPHFREALERWQYSNTLLLVDEVQDINPVLLEMIRWMNAPWMTIVVVGDEGQNIYKWRGSRHDGMAKLAHQINAKHYSLPISYRMPKNHIEMIREIDPDRHIEPFHEKNGRVVMINRLETIDSKLTWIDKLLPYLDNDLNKLVLARKRSSTINFALALIQVGQIVNVKGMASQAKIYAKQVLGFYKKGQRINFPTHQPELVFDLIEGWRRQKIKTLSDSNASTNRINEMNDWAVCLQSLFIGIKKDEYDPVQQKLPQSWEEWKENIEILSTLKRKGVIQVDTIHASKGAEAPIVVFIDPNDCPIRWPKQSTEDLQQENNTLFVAISRSKLTDHSESGTLILLVDGPVRNQQGWLNIAAQYSEMEF